jgi:hypothetical protein
MVISGLLEKDVKTMEESKSQLWCEKWKETQ